MATNNPPPDSPRIWEFPDFEGRVLRITVTYANNTRRLGTATIFREAGCLYRKIYFGLGDDGTPDTSTRTLTVPNGTTTFSRNQMGNVDLINIEDLEAVNFTVGP